MKLHEPPSDNELRDWLLYWNHNALPAEPQPTSSSTATHTSNDPEKRPSPQKPSDQTATTFTSLPAVEALNPSHPSRKSTLTNFLARPPVLLLGLAFQIFVFVYQFLYFREKGLPGFIANWPSFYAISAPANTCLYLQSVAGLAPMSLPGLMRVRYAKWSMRGILLLWPVWSLGLWLEVRRW